MAKATKQVRDHDPRGLYIRRWLPEFGTASYPAPIVDERNAMTTARQRLHALRQTRDAHHEASAIQHKHGSRRSGLPQSGTRARRTPAANDGQGRLL